MVRMSIGSGPGGSRGPVDALVEVGVPVAGVDDAWMMQLTPLLQYRLKG